MFSLGTKHVFSPGAIEYTYTQKMTNRYWGLLEGERGRRVSIKKLPIRCYADYLENKISPHQT